MTEITLFETEHIEYLGDSVGVIVSDAHTFGTDAMLLADFAAPKKKTVACDLGTGCGIIPMLWLRDGLCSRIDGVEIQKQAVSQFRRSIAANKTERVFAHSADLRALDGVLPSGRYDLVTMNPPYKALRAGRESALPQENIARHETLCTLSDVAASAARLLKYGGRFCLCIPPERLFEAMHMMETHAIEPKRLRTVAKNPDSAPWLCLLEGRRGGKRGLRIEPGLFLYTADGNPSAELHRIHRDYSKGAQQV